MKRQLFLWISALIALGTCCGTAQTGDARANPEVRNVIIEEGAVTTVYLSPGYMTSVRLPEEVSAVVVGNPLTFRAEHSESEARLVFLKPITLKPAESNALITTKSGQEISLHLISHGHGTKQERVDFLLEYRRPQSVLIGPTGGQNFFVAETKPISAIEPRQTGQNGSSDPVADVLRQQQGVASPLWTGVTLQVNVGESVEREHQTILGFSVLNNSKRTIEVLPPQIALSGRAGSGKGNEIKAEPIGIVDYRMTSKRLGPGERADGVVIFERPTFKESAEKLELQVAESGQVDHPVRVAVPFVATSTGGTQ
jgi:hypothetical protein